MSKSTSRLLKLFLVVAACSALALTGIEQRDVQFLLELVAKIVLQLESLLTSGLL